MTLPDPAHVSPSRSSPTDPPAGRATERGNAAPTGEVGAMFDRIAPVYDGINAVISGFQEPRWRRRAVAATGLRSGMAAIDVATGTGKLAGSLADRVGPFGRVLGVDVSAGMLERARDAGSDTPWLEFIVGDALALPADDASFDAVTCFFSSFGYFAGEEGEGGSAFTAPAMTSPAFFPTAVVTVLFRPFFLVETHNLQAMIQGLDGVVLAMLLAWRFPSLVQALRSFRSSPYIVLILVYLALLMMALMVVANFGTLARERSMVIPMLLMLVALPSRKEIRERQAAEAAVAAEGT